jgi:hypothetical protein
MAERRYPFLVVGLAVTVGLLAMGSTLAATGGSAANSNAATPSWAAWHQLCTFSHRNQDDAIVFPRQPGRMHDHTYFGNRSTDAFSTPASLRRSGRTTCGERADKSAYWAPTLFVAGRAVAPLGVVTRYLRSTDEPVESFPPGLKMIAGNMHAHTAQSQRVTSWNCAVEGSRRSSTMPTCPIGRFGGLILRVAFPDCWDGRRLDSADHKSHMAYSSKGACPRSHPVEVPGLHLFVFYPVRGGRTTELASGGWFSGHADFVNGWNQTRLVGLLDRYLNAMDALRPGAPGDAFGWVCEGCPRP